MTDEGQFKSPGARVKKFQNNLQGQEEKELFRKTKKSSHTNIQNISHLLPCKLPQKFIPWALR